MAKRSDMLDRLDDEKRWDIIVIGGGATGLGSALDAATRGYKTLLLEGQDFAQGTSSRSTKLIHGGVRYLARGEIPLVREALHERQALRANAPHLVTDRAFLAPAYNVWSKPFYGLGLKLYDLLAGARTWPGSRIIGAAEARTLIPNIAPENLRGGVLYHDGQFDDARLAICLMRSIADGTETGCAINHMRVQGFLKESGSIRGVRALDLESGREHTIRARAVINATGVFADSLRKLDEPEAAPVLEPSQGVHLVLDLAFLAGETALLVPKTSDGRVLFAIPWRGRTLLGTTDTPQSSVAIEPRPTDAEIDFLLEQAGRYFVRKPMRSDIKSAFAGLRPLVHGKGGAKETAKLSREHHIFISSSGLVTITGGKWTTYRVMAMQAVNEAAVVGGLEPRPCWTEVHRLHGFVENPEPPSDPLGVSYGTDAAIVDAIAAERPEWSAPLVAGLPFRAAEVVFAVRYELALTVEDVLSRRLRALLLDARASCECAGRVAEVMAEELGKDNAWRNDQTARFQSLAADYHVKA